MLLDMNVKLRRGHFDLTTQLSVSDISIGLFGKSGAGKSTVLNLIAGTIQPQSGYIVLDDKILFDSRKGIVMPREQRPIGAVLQIDCANSTETVRENLSSAYYRTLKQRRLFKLDYLIGLLELGAFLDQTIDLLTPGERQRVALARSLFKSPKIMLLDETFSAIGNGFRAQLLPILKRLQDEFGLPVMYASRFLGDILDLTDQLVVLDEGKVLRSGTLREVAKHQDR
jgi:molybdate transport system ATP-binding protein